MTAAPEVSVVMGVYNGARTLQDSVCSVLDQRGVELELIVVNDGSTDGSLEALQNLARQDRRVRVFSQLNRGLTQALILGCGEAQGRYIARQDVGDIFLPEKLLRQIKKFEMYPDAALVSCGTRFVGPEGEHLYDLINNEEDPTADLLILDVSQVRGPYGHGSVVFRKDLYDRAGGYRKQFYYAQDLDLWIRLAELGRHIAVPEILFQACFSVTSISGAHRARQIALAAMIIECAQLRRLGRSEDTVLERAAAIRPTSQVQPTRLDRAKALYFIGTCLRRRNDPRAAAYFRQAVRVWPFHVKAAMRLFFG